MSILNSGVFTGAAGGVRVGSMYNNVPQYDDKYDDVVWESRRGSGYGEEVRRNKGDSYTGGDDDGCTYSDSPTGGKAGPGKTGRLEKDQAVALFTFEADQAGDLAFEKGDIISDKED